MPRPTDHGRCQRAGPATQWRVRWRAQCRSLLLCWLGLAMIWPSVARAIDGDDLLVRAGVGLQYETNLFRLPSNPVSDLITFESAGLSFVRPTSAQIFRANFDVRNNHYRDNAYLDGIGYNAALGWRLLHGDADTLDVDVSYNRTLLGFADVRTTGRLANPPAATLATPSAVLCIASMATPAVMTVASTETPVTARRRLRTEISLRLSMGAEFLSTADRNGKGVGLLPRSADARGIR